MDLLISEAEGVTFSDFYSYRYFASEGFLPGYSFPRLPISAFIPGSGRRHNREEFLSRPRFLAVSEFGPRASVYHEGSRYLINRVILERDEQELLTSPRQAVRELRLLPPDPRPGRRPRSLRELRRRPRSSAAPALPPPERLHRPARPHQLRRGGTPAPRLRAPYRRPLRRQGRRPLRPQRHATERRPGTSPPSPTATPRPSGASTSAGPAARTRTSSASSSTPSAASGPGPIRRQPATPRTPSPPARAGSSPTSRTPATASCCAWRRITRPRSSPPSSPP